MMSMPAVPEGASGSDVDMAALSLRERWAPPIGFYLGVPAFTALLFGLNHAGLARLLPMWAGVPYWLGLTLPLWVLLDLCTRVARRLLSPWTSHLWPASLIGALVGIVLFSPYVGAYVRFCSAFTEAAKFYVVNTPLGSNGVAQWLAFASVPLYWLVTSFIFARLFGFPRYSRDGRGQPARGVYDGRPLAAASAHVEAEMPSFMALVPARLHGPLIALQAEDHYVRVHTERGNALIRYRFSEAVQQIRRLPGLQVHRSYWVATAAIKEVKSEGKGLRVVLANGLSTPVSRFNLGVLRTAGLL